MATSANFFSVHSAVGNNNVDGLLSEEIAARLRELEAEFLDGDITEKGFVKKKNRLLQSAHRSSVNSTVVATASGGNSHHLASTDSDSRSQLQEPTSQKTTARPAGNDGVIPLDTNPNPTAIVHEDDDDDEEDSDEDEDGKDSEDDDDDDDEDTCADDSRNKDNVSSSITSPAVIVNNASLALAFNNIPNSSFNNNNINNNHIFGSGATGTITLSCSKLKRRQQQQGDLLMEPVNLDDVTSLSNNDANNHHNGKNEDDDDFPDEIYRQQHYLNNTNGSNKIDDDSQQAQPTSCQGTLEDNRYQSEIRTEAVIAALNSCNDDHFQVLHQSVAIAGRGSRNRASSVSLSSKRLAASAAAANVNQQQYRRRKSTSSVQESKDAVIAAVEQVVNNNATTNSSESTSTAISASANRVEAENSSSLSNHSVTAEMVEQTTAASRPSKDSRRAASAKRSAAALTAVSTSPSSTNSASLPLSVSDSNSSRCAVSEQVPDIILDLRDLDNNGVGGVDDHRRRAIERNSNNNNNNNSNRSNGEHWPANTDSLGGSGGSTDLQQLILSNFNSGTASLGHKKNKKSKGKNKNFRAQQQVMYLAGRGTNANELTRTTSGALFAAPQPTTVTETPVFRGRVSTKIEQLARTLRRPKPRPLAEYFCDDSEILFTDASKNQPAAARASGQQSSNNTAPPEPHMSPIMTEPLKLTSGIPLNPLFALFRYGSSSTYRSPAISVVEPRTGKLAQTVFYHKLLENSLKLAYALSHPKKIFQLAPSDVIGASASSAGRKVMIEPLKPGSRVVLAYPMGDAISFATAFYACLLCGLVPVPIDPPSNTRREPFCQSIGIFVGAVGAEVVLTSSEAFRNLAKDPQTGGVSPIKCWPNVTWLLFDQAITTSLAKPSKAWKPHVTPENASNLESQIAFIQFSINREGDVLSVSLSYDCMTRHIQSLASALGVVEGQLVVNLLDVKRDVGVWFSLLASVYYGMHVIQVSFAQVKADPTLWLRIVSKHKPSVVVARSRDLYWTVLAHRAETMGQNAKSIKSLTAAATATPSSLKLAKMDLSSVRQLIIADAANSWTVSPCESFVNQFASHGFKADSITPVAFSPECLTVSVRRPGHVIGDARLSLDALSLNSVQIDCSTLRCLAIQDCGTPLPGTTLIVAKLTNVTENVSSSPSSNVLELCKADEIGELCIARHQQWSPAYFDLPGQTSLTFRLQMSQPRPQQPPQNPGISTPATTDRSAPPAVFYSRSGLFGFVSPTGSVFVVGSRELSIFTNGRRYSADDLSATILAVEPQNFVYRARLCVVPVKLARDERIVAVVEQNCQEFPTDSAAFAWMAKVIQAIDSLHNVSIYCLAVVQSGRLPRTPHGFINRHAVRRLFEDGHLHPTNILLCPHSAITNLPQPRLTPAAVHPTAQLLSNLLHGQKFAVAQGTSVNTSSTASMPGMAKSESFDSTSVINFNNGHNTVSSCTSGGSTAHRMTPNPHPMQSMMHNEHMACLPERLRILAQRDPDRVLFSFVNQKGNIDVELTALQLHRRAEKVACQLLDKARVSAGDRVVILLPAPSADFLAAIYGAFYVGCLPMVVRCPVAENLTATLSSCVLTVQICKPACLLCSPAMARFFRSKEAIKMLVPSNGAAGSQPSSKAMKKLPKVIAVDGSRNSGSSSTSKRLANVFRPQSLDTTLYIDLIVSTTGSLSGVRVSHGSALSLCRSVKMQAELYPSRDILLAGLDPLSGFGFVLFGLETIYAGHKTVVAPLTEIEADPFCWLRSVSTLQMRDVFVSPATLELCVRGFFQNPTSTPPLKDDETSKISLTNLRSCVVVSEERPNSSLMSQFVKAFQAFGLQRRCVTAAFGCRVNLAVCIQSSNAPEPEQVHIDTKSLRNDRLAIVERGSPYAVCLSACGRVLPGTKVIVANPETRAQLGEDHLGELWVASQHNTNGYFTVGGVTEGDPEASAVLEPFDARFSSRLETGDVSSVYARTGFLGFIRSGSMFVVGPIEQSIFVNNQRYQPCDLETTLQKLDPKRIPECAVFLASNLLVAVIEYDGPEAWALDLIPAATRCLLEAHQLIAGVVVIVEPGVVPLNSRGEKQRALLRDAFLADQLDPIYVSYNL